MGSAWTATGIVPINHRVTKINNRPIPVGKPRANQRDRLRNVITSYSIHYTKLYEFIVENSPRLR